MFFASWLSTFAKSKPAFGVTDVLSGSFLSLGSCLVLIFSSR